MSRTAGARAPIDTTLSGAIDRGEVPGIVAMAATAEGPVYEGAFGRRALPDGAAMTPDTLFRIQSMTKAVTAAAAMQLVERGRLSLDMPVPDIGEPALNAPQVLEGFDAAGAPRLRAARRPITLRHLLTHTSGFTYEFWNADTRRYVESGAVPGLLSGTWAAYRRPLAFDPGERWEYGIGIDWVGRLVEAASGQPLDAYLREHIFAPLGMADTGFVPSPAQQARLAATHQRQADGGLLAQQPAPVAVPEFCAGGGGLYATAPDYLRFLEMLLRDGSSAEGVRILAPQTVAAMNRNQIGDLPAGIMTSAAPEVSNDVDFFPGAAVRWSLGHMLNVAPGPNGRSAGTVSWGGLRNSYYWLDPARRIAGVMMTQILPFADPAVLRLYGGFERGIYALAEAVAA
jgi:CubicO group peptidase (beta-lactamase class C family)